MSEILAVGVIWVFVACFLGLLAGAIMDHCSGRDDEL
jgi:hypothetical protein